MKRLDTMLDNVKIGDAVKLYFSNGEKYIGYLHGVNEDRVNLSSFSDASSANDLKTLCKGKFCGREVIGYEPFKHQRMWIEPRHDKRPHEFSAPRPFGNSYDREITDEEERLENKAEMRRIREEENSQYDGIMHRDI